ncbi:MAG: hypothetical protein GF353_19180 [Candidatus Lokiarchaeota archaeon]|nr:hypothetical protein [Candidatus Lokiarchaeota archaeon]
MEEIKKKYSKEMDYLYKNFNQEVSDIINSIEIQSLHLGSVAGHLKISFNKNIPETFRLVHLNRVLLGIGSLSLDIKESAHTFNFDNSSIYKFLCEFEYLRGYIKYKELKTKAIEFSISNLLSPLNNEVEISKDYLNKVKTEWSDIKHSFQIARLFSGSLIADFTLKYPDLNIVKNKSGDFTSSYLLFSEIQKLREYRNEKISEDLVLKISNLDDSKVPVRERLFKRRDEEALITY